MAAAPFEELASLAAQGRKLVYIPNDGNQGDSLITIAALQAFERRGIDYTVFKQRFVHKREHVYVYAGGGNFVPMYRGGADTLKALSPAKADVVILPHSCYGVDRTILDYPGSLRIWARERQTYRYLQGLERPGYSYGLADDLALDLRLDDKRFYYFHVSRALLRSRPRAPGGVLNAFRVDVERKDRQSKLPEPNFDISNMHQPRSSAARGFWQGGLDIDLLFLHASWFLAFIDGFDTVRTDRLHVGIAAMLLGKEVELHDNAYGKVSAVYEHSLRDRPNVRLVAG